MELRGAENRPREKTLFLTFDDGPSSIWTEKILDLLKEYDIKAAFFTVGTLAERNPDVVRRAFGEGHTVGIHSYTHKSAWLMTKKQFRVDLEKSMVALQRLGIAPKYYRPPWGQKRRWTEEFLKEMGLKLILWDVMAEDWKKNTSWEEIRSKLLNRAFDGSVICLHDGRGRENAPERTFRALEKTIPIWKERGFSFKKVEEGFGDGYSNA